jgi:hypothetical protein
MSGDDPPVASAQYWVNFSVIPPPPGIPLGMLTPRLGSNKLHYGSTFTAQFIESGGVEDGIIPDEMPVFGGQAFKVLAAANVSAEVDGGDGTGRGDITLAGLPTPWKIAGAEIDWSIGGSEEWHYIDGTGWVAGGSVHVGASTSMNVPPHPHYIIFMAGPVPVPVYVRGKIELGVDATLTIQGWAGEGAPLLNGSMLVNPYAEVMLGVGAADVAAVEGYLGGGANLGLQWPEEPLVSDLEIYLVGGVRITLLIFKYEWPLLEYSWDLYDGKRVLVATGEPKIGLIPRDYLYRDKHGYAVFVANESWRDKSRDAVTEEIPIELNVFGQSTPHLVASGNDLILAWVYDDPIRTPTNRTEIVFSAYDSVGETWSMPAPIADDGTADFHPQMAMLPGGDALVAWENVSEVLIEPGELGDPCIDQCLGDPDPEQCQVECKLEEMKSKTEIAIAEYDALSGTWFAQMLLSSNGILDRSPRLSVGTNGTAMLTWISNAANHEIGSNGVPNDINYAIYDGVSWTSPTIATNGVPSIIKSTMAYSGSEAILLFIGDTDADPQTPDDRELFGVQFDGVVWGAGLAADGRPHRADRRRQPAGGLRRVRRSRDRLVPRWRPLLRLGLPAERRACRGRSGRRLIRGGRLPAGHRRERTDRPGLAKRQRRRGRHVVRALHAGGHFVDAAAAAHRR